MEIERARARLEEIGGDGFSAASRRDLKPEDYLLLARFGDVGRHDDLAENPACPPEALEAIVERGGRYAYKVARNPKAPPSALARLADIVDESDLRDIAKHPNAPPEVLETLASEHEDARLSVAENPNTPPELLAKLATDSDVFVRRATAENPNTPTEALRPLVRDPADTIMQGMARKQLIERTGSVTLRFQGWLKGDGFILIFIITLFVVMLAVMLGAMFLF